jgi:hypothetical protein
MPYQLTNEGSAVESIKIPLAARADAGVLGFWENTRNRPVLIIERNIHVTTTSTGAATADMGIAATEVTNDTLIDGAALNGLAANTVVQAAGSNGASQRIVPAGHFVTIFGSAATTGLVADAHISVVEQ